MIIGFRVPTLRPTGDRDHDVFQREVREAFDSLKSDALLSFSARKSVSVGTSNTKVPHGLGRVPQGWVITDKTGPGDVYRVSWDSQFVTLIASSAVTASFRFF